MHHGRVPNDSNFQVSKPDHVVTNPNMPSLAEVAVFERKIIRIRFARFGLIL